MKSFVTGALGQLGQDLRPLLDADTVWTDRLANPELGIDAVDITDQAAVQAAVQAANPQVIYHCAAYTNVDGAETDQATARAVNVDGTRYVADAAEAVGAKLVAISTDYVFSGENTSGYTEDDVPDPVSVYGRTKRDGEKAALESCSRSFVVRTAGLYGPKHEQIEVKNFVKTMQRLAKEQLEISVVSDQIGSPTFTCDLAEALLKLAATEEYGVWHIVNSGTASWYDFASTILADAIKEGLVVKPIPSSNYPTKAKRPLYSVLKTDKFINRFGTLRSWQDALTDYLNTYALYPLSRQ